MVIRRIILAYCCQKGRLQILTNVEKILDFRGVLHIGSVPPFRRAVWTEAFAWHAAFRAKAYAVFCAASCNEGLGELCA